MGDATDEIFSRDELVTLVAKAHGASSYGDSSLAGRALAAQSRLPKLVATNLGAGFGQWDFFPEPAEIVDFALGYAAPATPDDVWRLARAWAEDDAAGKHTLMALVGRDILQHELRRIDVAELRELFDETRGARVHELRVKLGLPTKAPAVTAKSVKRTPAVRAPALKGEVPARMPKPEFKRLPPKAPPPPPKRFAHPKFGEGVLETKQGEGPEAKLTIKFQSGSKTLLARFVTELPA
jgi:hypothetical protein